MVEDRKPTQKTQPRGTDDEGKPAKPIDIPVPKRSDVRDLLKKAAAGARKRGKDAAVRGRKVRERSDAARDRQGRRDATKPPPKQHQRRSR
jgi:hypothetical protein